MIQIFMAMIQISIIKMWQVCNPKYFFLLGDCTKDSNYVRGQNMGFEKTSENKLEVERDGWSNNV